MTNANANDEHWYRWRHAYLRDFHLLAYCLHDRAMELAASAPIGRCARFRGGNCNACN
jgi:hypothetical protein